MDSALWRLDSETSGAAVTCPLVEIPRISLEICAVHWADSDRNSGTRARSGRGTVAWSGCTPSRSSDFPAKPEISRNPIPSAPFCSACTPWLRSQTGCPTSVSLSVAVVSGRIPSGICPISASSSSCWGIPWMISRFGFRSWVFPEIRARRGGCLVWRRCRSA